MSDQQRIVDLRPIDKANWQTALRLRLAPGQERFIAANPYTIIQGHFENLPVYGIYNGTGEAATMIGLTMYGYVDYEEDGFEPGHEIVRLMIDVEYQDQGYGRATLNKIISELKADPPCPRIYITFNPENDRARHLYSSVGFTDTGRILDDQCVFVMPIK